MITRTALRRRCGAVLPAIAAALALALSGCGGGSDEQDAEDLLDRAFGAPIPSATVDISAELDLDGLAQLGGPLRIRASGPYIRGEGQLPQVDIDVEVRAQEGGGALDTGFLSTGERVFVEFGGVYYEQSPERVEATNRRLAREREDGRGSLADLGLDARAWVVDAQVEGEEEVGGVATEHVTGTLDVEAMLEDLDELVGDSAGALGAGGARELGEREIARLARAVDDPGFDVYVGRDDDVIRRLTVRLDVTVPEDDRRSLGGIERASIRFSLELDDVGGDQVVTAPRTVRPISDLTSLLGGLDALAAGSLGAGGDASSDGAAPDPGGPAGDATAEDFEAYGDCLEQAAPDDTEAIDRCAQLLP